MFENPEETARAYGYEAGEDPPPARPQTIAQRAAAASAPAEPTAKQHHEAGAYARSVLTEQLEAARERRDATLDMLNDYQEQLDAEQLAVHQLELALEDLGNADRARALEDGDPHR